MKNLVAYVPVLHAGYLRWFEKHKDARVLYVLHGDALEEFKHLRKDLRALSADQIVRVVSGLGMFPEVAIAGPTDLADLGTSGDQIVMPDEEECRAIAKRWLDNANVEFDSSVFLRWDRTKALAKREVRTDEIVSFSKFDQQMITRAYDESLSATNLWRRVGAALIRRGVVMLAGCNCQIPSVYTPYYEGDARGLFSQGLHIELTTDEHAEARLIGEAANLGIPLNDADLYVTTFPCPPCAKLVRSAGIARVFFAEGYAMFDGERALKDADVEIIRVEMENPAS